MLSYTIIEVIGWMASLVFAVSILPQAYKSYKEGNAEGMSLGSLILWTLGDVLMLAYVMIKHGNDLPLIVDCTVNLWFLMIIWKYRFFPRNQEKPIKINLSEKPYAFSKSSKSFSSDGTS